MFANTSKVYHNSETHDCNDHIFIKEDSHPHKVDSSHPIHIVDHDGVYVFAIQMNISKPEYTVGVHVEIKNDYGYLSAADWPLLPFYGFMCIFYVFLGIIWLVMSFMQWRDLLRVQFWIGAVILLGK